MIGRILGALSFGVGLGTGLLALVTWTVRALQATRLAIAAPGARGFTPGLLPVLLLGTLGATTAAGIAAWSLLGPLGNPWRKAMLAIVAGAGSFVVALVTWPVERAFGRNGLLVLAAACGGLCLLLGWRLSRAERTE